MIEAADAGSLIRKDGWLEIYRSQAGLDARLQEAREAAEYFGVTHDALDRPGLKQREPQLSDRAIGAIHWTNSWGVEDPGGLVAAYARSFEREGGRFVQSEIQDVSRNGEGWRVETDGGVHEAQEVVVALGPWAGDWMKRLGYRMPTFVKRGYHMHYDVREGQWLHHWLLDAEVGYILAPMRAGIRLTTGAELKPLEAAPDYGQLTAAERVARELYPALGERLDETPWKGARPCLPDMKPVIGPGIRHAGLWFAFGHGHQGFTLGPATGRVLAEMMEGEAPAIDMAPFRADRFGT